MADETEGFSSWATVAIIVVCVAGCSGCSPGSFISVTVFGASVTAWVKATVKEVICEYILDNYVKF